MGNAKDDDDFNVEIWDVNIFSLAKEKNGQVVEGKNHDLCSTMSVLTLIIGGFLMIVKGGKSSQVN